MYLYFVLSSRHSPFEELRFYHVLVFLRVFSCHVVWCIHTYSFYISPKIVPFHLAYTSNLKSSLSAINFVFLAFFFAFAWLSPWLVHSFQPLFAILSTFFEQHINKYIFLTQPERLFNLIGKNRLYTFKIMTDRHDFIPSILFYFTLFLFFFGFPCFRCFDPDIHSFST